MPLQVENRKYPTAVATAFGRAFYGVSNRVYFSQVFIDDAENLGKCYQKNDPSSEEFNDILDTDGGEVLLQNSGNINSMVEFGLGILIFAERGMWYLSGGQSGFTATSYTLRKVSSTSACSSRGIVSASGAIYYASFTGIHLVIINENGQVQVDNITEESINSYWTSFASRCLIGTYDDKGKQIIWVQSQGQKWLIQDLRLGSFYPQEWGMERPIYHVFYNREQELQFAFSSPDKGDSTRDLTFSLLNDSTFEDFNVPFSSHLLTNFETVGNFSRNKGIPIMSAYFQRTETTIDNGVGSEYVYDKPSGCELTVLWDWSNNDSYNRITESKPIYSPLPKRRSFMKTTTGPEPLNTGETVIQFKDKVRGRGKAVQFKFESEEGKDMQLLGYSVNFSSKGRQ